jgi:hypothetical protein
MNIVFCHNVYNRFKTLNNTIRIEKILFSNSITIIGYNDINPEKELDIYSNIKLIKYNGLTHKIGCVNGCIVTIKEAIKYNPDVIVFSHDDVSMNFSEQSNKTFLKNVSIITDGECDVICRRPKYNYGNNYYLMEVFMLSKHSAEKCFSKLELLNNEQEIPLDIRNSISPEVFLYNVINNKELNILEYEYDNNNHETYNTYLDVTLGFHHKNAGERGWKDN